MKSKHRFYEQKTDWQCETEYFAITEPKKEQKMKRRSFMSWAAGLLVSPFAADKSEASDLKNHWKNSAVVKEWSKTFAKFKADKKKHKARVEKLKKDAHTRPDPASDGSHWKGFDDSDTSIRDIVTTMAVLPLRDLHRMYAVIDTGDTGDEVIDAKISDVEIYYRRAMATSNEILDKATEAYWDYWAKKD